MTDCDWEVVEVPDHDWLPVDQNSLEEDYVDHPDSVWVLLGLLEMLGHASCSELDSSSALEAELA